MIQHSSSLARVLERRAFWKSENKKVGLTNGCFDLLHPGHIALLSYAVYSCDRLIVAINSDESVRKLKGPGRPVNSAEDRALALLRTGKADAVLVFDEPDPELIIRAILPDILVKGGDYEGQDIIGREIVEEAGGYVLLAPYLPGYSTSAIIEGMRR